jgi:polyferredoxin
MLKKIRVVLAIVVIAILTFGFIDFAGVIENPWLQKIQFAPALFSLSITTLIILVVGTLLFGRVYCSVICPLGIFQDLFNWIAKKTNKKKKFGYKPERTWLRWGVLAALIVAWIFGFTFLVSLVEPYSAYGRMATQLFKPLYILGNNLLAVISEKTGSYTFFFVELTIRSVTSFTVAVLTLGIIGFISFKFGRTWCNTICPVGTVLGGLSRFSVFKVQIDTDKCNHCSLCSRKCKAYCIDSANQTIDHSRCVTCFDCIDNCKQKAIKYVPSWKKSSKESVAPVAVDESKRQFLKSALAVATMVPATLTTKAAEHACGCKIREELTPLSPPGSISHKNLLQHCTACHLCISKCPSNVLKPAGLEYGIGGIMQPVMKFDKGYCNYDCTVCSEICPNGAIKPLTVEQKHKTQPGKVAFSQCKCVVEVNGTSCGACAEHCPTQAVRMVPYKNGITIPEIHPELCVGCGGCELICPVKAIFINGNEVHLEAKEPENTKREAVEDFGFGF